MRIHHTTLAGILCWALGCQPVPIPKPESDSAKTALAFGEAILRQDWPAAYATLHPDSQMRLSLNAFSRLAVSYRRNLGFEPRNIFLRAGEEHGDQAIVHLVFKGPSSHHRSQYREGLILRPMINGWGVVLPNNFGRALVQRK